MKKSLLLTTSLLAVLNTYSAQAVEVSANVGLYSDYVFRGVSQTDEKASIQGGFDAAWDSGVWAGVYVASNNLTNFGLSDGSTETSLYVAYSNVFGDSDIAYDVGLFHFVYEGNSDANYQELYFATYINDLTLGLWYSPEWTGDFITDFAGDEVSFLYPYAEYSFALPSDVSLTLHVGYSDFSEDGMFEEGEDSYIDWSIGIAKEFAGVEVSLTYTDTNIDELLYVGSGLDDADARIVLGFTKAL